MVKLTDRWFEFPPDFRHGWDIIACKAKFIFIQAGRRALKTESCKRKLVLSLPADVGWDRPRYGFGAPIRPQAKEIAWQDFKDLIPKRWIENISETELKITTKFGSTLQIYGMDSPERIEGGGFNGFVVDERSDIKPRAINISILPALADRDGWLIQSGVGKRQGIGAHSFNEDIDKVVEGRIKNGRFFHWRSDEVLDEKQLSEFRDAMDDKDYREQFEAERVKAGGGVFYNWSEANEQRCEYDPNLPIIVACDFNVDPMCWVFLQDPGNSPRVFDELWMRDCNTERALNETWRKFENHRSGFIWYGDATGKARKTSASESDYIQICNDTRFDKYRSKWVKFPSGNPRQHNRISSCTHMICDANGNRRLLVDPSCTRLIKDLTVRTYKEGSCEFDDGPLVGHITDALGYYLHVEYPRELDTGDYSNEVELFYE